MMKVVNNGSLCLQQGVGSVVPSEQLAPLLPSVEKKEEQYEWDLIMRSKSFFKKYPGQEIQLHRMIHRPHI